MTNHARVAVIIVNLNGGDDVLRSLEAVRGQTIRPHRVILVDNGSTDGSAEAIATRYPDIGLIKAGHNIGFAKANNLAVQAAGDCEWIATVNPDAFPEPQWLAALLEAARVFPDCAFFASRLLLARDPSRLDGAGDVYHVSGLAWRRGHGRPVSPVVSHLIEVFSACAAAALYRRDAFLAAGGFDESFFCYMEDVDLGFRLRLLGHRCLYIPEAVAHHVGSSTTGLQSHFTVYHGHRNLVWVFFKNMPARLFWRYLPLHVLANLYMIARYALRGDGPTILKAKWDALRGIPRVWRVRANIQSRRVVDVQHLLHSMARGIPGR